MSSPMEVDAVLQMVREALVDRFDTGSIDTPETTLIKDLGLDSLQMMDIMLTMEDRLGVRLVEVALPPNPSLRDVAAIIHANLPK